MSPSRAFAILAALSFGVWAGGLDISWYSDDFQFIFADPAGALFGHFTERNPANDFYRPTQSMALAAIQLLWGLDTRPIHLLQILLHAVLAWTVWRGLTDLGLSRWAALLGGLSVVVHPSAALAVLSNDTLAQVLGTVAGALALWRLHTWLEPPPRGGRAGQLAGALALFAVSLFSKETSVSFCLLVGGLVVARRWGHPGALRGIVSAGAPFVIVAVVYLVARYTVVPSRVSLGDARYQFAFGTNLLKNLGMLVGAGLWPSSTADAFAAARARDLLSLAPPAVSMVAWVCALGAGGWRLGQPRRVAWVGFAILAATVPAVALNHVSEGYTYNVLPFLGLGIGLGVEGWLRRPPAREGRLALAALTVGILFWNLQADRAKAAEMQTCGLRADVLAHQVVDALREAPPGATVLLVDGGKGPTDYSVFRISGFGVLEFGGEELKRRAGRPDLTLRLARGSGGAQVECPAPCVRLGIRGDRVLTDAP